MVNPTVRDQILTDLEQLSPEEQELAARRVHDLVSTTPKGVPGRDLLQFAGVLDAQSVREMTAAIEEGCERE
jgi:hypothetical protein